MDFIQAEILSESYKKDDLASGTSSDQQSDEAEKKVQLKITRINENFLSSLKRKRKVSTDSLESLTDESSDKHQNVNSSSKVEQFLSETGLNAQLIARNDKKLVKLNVNTNKANNHSALNYNTNNLQHHSHAFMHDFDDLPSESDISNATIVIPITNTLSQAAKLLPFDKLTQNKSVSVSFKCVKCNKIFTNEDSLRLHQLNNCSNENLDENLVNLSSSNDDDDKCDESKKKIKYKKQQRTFICTECGMQYTSQFDLSKHMLQTHENSKPFECSMCDMKFNDLSSKNRHEKEHAGLKPFRCWICSFEFTRASNLRTHLLKVHSSEIGKLVHIHKTVDKKLKFEFDMEAISSFKHDAKLQKNSSIKTNASYSSQSSVFSSNNSSQATSTPHANNTNNTIIYIKDPNNKNADIQHMVVYVDGKPIFVQNPKLNDSPNKDSNLELPLLSTFNQPNENSSERIQVKSQKNESSRKKQQSTASNYSSKSSNFIGTSCKPVVKIPYLLAAAAAAAASNQRKQQSNNANNTNTNKLIISSSDCCARSSTYPIMQSNAHNSNTNEKNKVKVNTDFKQDLEYIQLVSLLKQKNEKLFNPLQNKT